MKELFFLKRKSTLFALLALFSPVFVYAQLIDNRDLPPSMLQVRPPFVETDRSVVSEKDDKFFIVLDNADDIQIQDFTDSGTTEAVMVGNVRVRFSGSFLRSEKLIITLKDNVVLNVGAYGNVEFTLSGTKYLADSLNYQPDMERGVMYNVRSLLSSSPMGGYNNKPWFYRAEKVTIEAENRFVLENVQLSTSDTRFDHFSIKVSKLWYLEGKVTLVAGVEYMTGQASFLWFPVFLQLDGAGSLRTSFGSEKRIGYYVINNIDVNTKIGKFEFGFDTYERQGQYAQMDYKAPKIGMIQKLELNTKIANDVRIIKDGNLYSQWVTPGLSSEAQRITQFAWYYKLNMSIATNGISFDFNIEDLNDPFFIPKYSTRSRFDDAEHVDYAELLNPALNSWYGYQGDAQPSYSSITRGFNLRVGKLNMSGNWELLQITRPEKTDNEFLNEYYDYKIRTMTLPSITYNFGSLQLADYKYVTSNKITVMLSDGKSNIIDINKLAEYEEEVTQLSNRSVRREILVQDDGAYQTNYITNWTPVTIKNVVTNGFTWVDLGASASASAKYSAQRTFGTNDSSTVQDLSLLNTNWVAIADLYQHEETGAFNFASKFFDNLLSVNNTVNMSYKEVWSSFGDNYTNNMRDSGMRVDYTLGTTASKSKIWKDDETDRAKVGFSSSVNYSYPLYYLLRLQEDYVRESSLAWNNAFSWEWLQWKRQPILGGSLTANWNLRFREPTEEQQSIIDNDPDDIYFGKDKIYDRVTLGAKARIFWFNLGTETTIDILETTTNDSSYTFVPVTGDSFTNKFIGGYPKLLVEFSPDADFYYLPKAVYRYNLFEQSRAVMVTNGDGDIIPSIYREDKSFNLEVSWDVRLKNYQIPALYPFIYELSEFGFVLQYYEDYINVRNSYLSLNFVLGVKFTKYWTFRFSSQMLNSKLYLYRSGGMFNGEYILAPGENYKPFWEDLWDGLSIWDQEALKESSFKLQSLNFELIHDLDSWDMRVIFNLGRRVDDVKQVAFWEPYIGVAFTMKGSSTASIFPEFQKRFVPSEYQ